MNRKMNKLISIFMLLFIGLFINMNNVYASNVTCNYRIDQGTDGEIDVVLSYNNDTSKKNMYPTITYNITEGIKIKGVSAAFQIREIGTDNGGCPANLYSVYHSSSSDDGYSIDFYLSESAATSSSNSRNEGTLSSYTLANNTDYTKKSTCEYYENLGGTQSTSNKLIIYYDKGKTTTPEISYNGQYSSDSNVYRPSFDSSSLTTCPPRVYGADAMVDGVPTTTFYLSETEVKKVSNNYITFSNSDEYGSAGKIRKTDVDGLDPNSGDIKINCSDFSALHIIYNIVLIIAPILVILFGTIDYSKAVMTSDLEKMDKFKKRFKPRLIAVIVLFLVPLLIKLILSLNPNLSNTMLNCVVNGKDAEIKLNASEATGSTGIDTGSVKSVEGKNTSTNTGDGGGSSKSFGNNTDTTTTQTPVQDSDGSAKIQRSNSTGDCSKCAKIPSSYTSARAQCEKANNCKITNNK